MRISPHFCEGHFPVAFLFSAPGDWELRRGKPVAGDTGTNLELALIHLHLAQPTLFPSLCRYDYRITNAFSEPIAISLGNRGSEARDAEVLDTANVNRVIRELDGCNLVVLGGNKARLLAHVLRNEHRTVIEVPHVGNKGLNAKFTVPSSLGLASSADRRKFRVQQWAIAVLKAIGGECLG